jgi:hypothetical protein
MSKLLVEHFLQPHEAPPEELVLNFDATDDPALGQHEERFCHGYYQHYGFFPLYVFCGGHLLVSILSPANIDPAKYSLAPTTLLVECMASSVVDTWHSPERRRSR